jgi:hypothetical protein
LEPTKQFAGRTVLKWCTRSVQENGESPRVPFREWD